MGVGCSTDRSGMCLAGGISLAAGAITTAGAIGFLMLPALAKINVRPLFGGEGMIVGLTPTGVVGSF